MPSPIDPVLRQLDAFNRHDLEGFLAAYSAEAVVVGVASEPIVGADDLRKFYAPRLADHTLACVVESLTLHGDRFVVAREFVLTAETSTETIATFEVVDELIVHASMVKAPPLPR